MTALNSAEGGEDFGRRHVEASQTCSLSAAVCNSHAVAIAAGWRLMLFLLKVVTLVCQCCLSWPPKL